MVLDHDIVHVLGQELSPLITVIVRQAKGTSLLGPLDSLLVNLDTVKDHVSKPELLDFGVNVRHGAVVAIDEA